MSKKVLDEDGVTEIEVYTADEMKAAREESAKAKDAEYAPKLSEADKEKERLTGLLATRAEEFKGFRKLTDESVAKLSVAERTIYENGVALEEERKKRTEIEKKNYEAQVDTVLKAKSNGDEKLFTKMKEVWAVIGIEAITPDQIEKKASMALGSLRASEPDLVASVIGAGNGAALPPKAGGGEKSFADSDKGKAAAAELGLALEAPKK